MQLLTKTEKHSADIAADTERLGGFISTAIGIANGIAAKTLALSNEDLALWLNAKPPEQRMSEFASHGQIGDGLNAIAALVEEKLGPEEEEGKSLGRVDVRPVPEKLAAQGRSMDLTEAGFVVTDVV